MALPRPTLRAVPCAFLVRPPETLVRSQMHFPVLSTVGRVPCPISFCSSLILRGLEKHESILALGTTPAPFNNRTLQFNSE